MTDKPWRELFCGRDAELAMLQEAYRKVADPDATAPQLVALVAESGLGKTRLVQEFYNWLSTEIDETGGTGYWPDHLVFRHDNNEVNPDLAACRHDRPMRFLWWGLRCHDPGRRNAPTADALAGSLPCLTPHLEPMLREKRAAERRAKAGWTAGKFAEKAADAGVDIFLSTIPGVSDL